MTKEEVILWEKLRNRKIENTKFLRQHTIKFIYEGKMRFFVADFYCADKKLIIEIDGKIHLSQIEKDKLRNEVLNELGYEVIRFTNEEVNNNIEYVIEKIKEWL